MCLCVTQKWHIGVATALLSENVDLRRPRRGGCQFRSKQAEVIVGSAAMLVAWAKSDEGLAVSAVPIPVALPALWGQIDNLLSRPCYFNRW